MENPGKHDKKTTTKTLPLALKMGACRFGIGGIVLVGGVLIAASIMSTLAFRKRSQRRSPEPDKESVDGPRKLELVMKVDKDSFSESLPLEVKNPSNDEVANMKENQTENIQSLTLDESHHYEQSVNGNKDMIDSVVSKDEEKTLNHVNSVFESEESGESNDSESEEQVVMAVKIENELCLERDDCDGSKEQKHLMLIDHKNDEHVDVNSLKSEEKDIVSEEASENEDDDQETESMNETIPTADCVDHIEVEDNLQVEEIENNTHYVDQIGHEVVKEEERIDAACVVNLVNMEDAFDPYAQELYQTFAVAEKMFNVAVDDLTTPKEDATLKDKETAQKVEEEENLLNEDEMHNVDEMLHEQLIEATKVDEKTDNRPRELMITEHDLINKHEKFNVDEMIHEAKVDCQMEKECGSFTEDENSKELTPEAPKIEENKEEVENLTSLSQKQDASKEDKGKHAGEPWDLKLMALSVLISVWCICHWYSELPFPELSLVGSLLFILAILGYRNRATYLVKYERK